jgi:hypothetical protein
MSKVIITLTSTCAGMTAAQYVGQEAKLLADESKVRKALSELHSSLTPKLKASVEKLKSELSEKRVADRAKANLKDSKDFLSKAKLFLPKGVTAKIVAGRIQLSPKTDDGKTLYLSMGDTAQSFRICSKASFGEIFCSRAVKLNQSNMLSALSKRGLAE